MLKISIHTYGKNLKELMFDLKKNKSKMEGAILDLGSEIHTFMTSFIKSNLKRPGSTGNLIRSISYRGWTGVDNFGFEIGDISVLNSQAPYWKVINDGGVVPPVSFGMFVPGDPQPSPSAFRQGRWFESEGGEEFGHGWKMTPKRAIPAMNYIEQSHHLLRIKLASILRKAKRGKF